MYKKAWIMLATDGTVQFTPKLLDIDLVPTLIKHLILNIVISIFWGVYLESAGHVCPGMELKSPELMHPQYMAFNAVSTQNRQE